MKKITGYKGFNPGLTCHGVQFVEGEMFEEESAVVCESGFHFCEYPLDVFAYYPPATSVYHEVEAHGDIVGHDEDTKVATTKIKVNGQISLAQMVQAAVDFTFSRAKKIKSVSSKSKAGAARPLQPGIGARR